MIIEDNIQFELEKKYSDKWSWTQKSDEQLKLLAKDLYNGLIFTDRHIRNQNNLPQIFMPIMFMGPQKSSDNRDSKIYDLIEQEIEEKHYQEFISKIGLIFEYLDKRGPMNINGQPMFMSMQMLNQSDTEKMFELYEKYKSLREGVDNF